MRKMTFHSKNSTAGYYTPSSGMVNTVNGEYLKEEQASYLGSVTFDENKKTYTGSGKYVPVNLPVQYKFSRLYNVMLNGEEKLFGSYSGGVYNITDNKDYILDKDKIPSDIIYNQDGVFVSSANNIYNITNDNKVEKLTFSLSPFAWQNVLMRASGSANSNALIYYGGKVYFSDIRGLGYFVEGSDEMVILNAGLGELDFYIFNNILFAEDDANIYTIREKNVTLFYNKAPIGNAYRHSAGYDRYLLAVKERNGRYDICRLDIYNKQVSYIPLNVTNGIGNMHLNFLRVLNNKLYLIINALVPVSSGSNVRVSSYLYEIELVNNQYSVVDKILEDYDIDLYLYNIFNISSATFCTFGAPFERVGLEQPAPFTIMELHSDGSLIKLNYLFAPDAYQSSVYIAVSGSRVYTANHMGIYYVDIKADKSDIPCLFIQNGRLVAPQGSSLYFSGTGDFYNWSYGNDSDALFCEIGYKDGGSIIYAVVVYDSIIVFKDNGSIYRLAGSYPLWSISKLGEINVLRSRAITAGSEIIFATQQGIKRLGVTQNFGDFFISDYQNLIYDNNINDISVCSERNALLFSSDNRIYEYNNIIKAFYVFTDDADKSYKQCIEIYNNNNYSQYSLSREGILHKLDISQHNNIRVLYRKIKTSLNIVVRSVVFYTEIFDEDREIVFKLDNVSEYKFKLSSGTKRHKFFITRRINELQPEIIHAGDMFINTFFIDYSLAGI